MEVDKFWIVVNTTTDHRYRRHGSYAEAEAEAKRLAAKQPGDTFMMFTPSVAVQGVVNVENVQLKQPNVDDVFVNPQPVFKEGKALTYDNCMEILSYIFNKKMQGFKPNGHYPIGFCLMEVGMTLIELFNELAVYFPKDALRMVVGPTALKKTISQLAMELDDVPF